MRSRRTRHARRGMAIYFTVVSTALIVSLLGLTGLTLVRIERKQMAVSNERTAARMNARSAVDLALRVIANDSNWRTTYTNGVETTPQSLHANASGTLSWILEDSDGSLTDADTNLRLKGVGRVGNTVQVSSVKLLTTGTANPEQTLLNAPQTDGSGVTLEAGLGIGITFTPTLPVGASSWSITRIQFWGNGFQQGSFDAKVTTQDAFGNPVTVIDSVNVQDRDLSNNFAWNEIVFNNADGLSPTEGACVIFVHASGGKCARIKHEELPNTSPEKRLMTTNGGFTWNQDQNDLWIKIWGTYSMPGSPEAVSGTWIWDAAP
jgi:Tfp pilus assembly protein PilX